MVPLLIVLLMSAVPVALPVMFTVSMAFGSKDLAKRGVLVTRLSAVEDAATMDVLCVDKTGTITMNQLAVTGVMPMGGAAEGDVFTRERSPRRNPTRTRSTWPSSTRRRNGTFSRGLPQAVPGTFKPFDRKADARRSWWTSTDSVYG